MPTTIVDLPIELFIDHLLPFISTHDLPNLALTSRFFAQLINDDTFWKRKLEQDHNFPGKTTARTSGWKTIYRGMHHPRVFVWGEKGQGRLGMQKYPKSWSGHVSSPAQLDIPGVRLVSLVAGGMSFHALDSKGDLYVWGTLDGSSFALDRDGYSNPGKSAPTPLKLDLPDPTRFVSCGRLHAATFDVKGRIWNMVNWGRPFQLDTSLLHDVIQIECGWAFTSALTKSGDIYAWFPFAGALQDRLAQKETEMNQQGDRSRAFAQDGLIRCVTWNCDWNPTVLPPPPTLPVLLTQVTEPAKIVQIAAMDLHIIALTNQGHILKFGVLEDEHSAANGVWTYLPQFSDVRKLAENPAYSDGDNLVPPSNMHISHISAHFHHFIAYSTGSSSVVLIGTDESRESTPAQIIPSLQNRGVISVVLGDYHFGALTDSGQLFTWGQYSSGALGLGDPAELELGTPGGYDTIQQRNMARQGRRVTPPDVTLPSRVKFLQVKGEQGVKEKNVFCFAATASGWHMGALVIDLDPDLEEEAVRVETNDEFEAPRHPPSRHVLPSHGPSTVPTTTATTSQPRGGTFGTFRIGHAGRGAGRGSSITGLPEEPVNTNQQEAGDPPIVQRGVPFFRARVGFPGRFMNRGGRGFNGPEGEQ